MSIVTKNGDKGKTIIGGRSVRKDDELVEAVGAIDELMAVLAIVGKQVKAEKITTRINQDLFWINGHLAGEGKELRLEESIKMMEKDIGQMENKMGKIDRFLEPGEELNEWFNWARTVARRAERRMVKVIKNGEMLIFFNRLSDYLFILSRQIKLK